MSAPASAELPGLYLKRREEHRLRNGHPWIFSNEVDTARSPFKAFAAGDDVTVYSHQGKVLGTASVNPSTLICARMVSRRGHAPLSRDGLETRIRRALGLRDRLFATPHYRLVYGESDGLPGLVVDRFGDVLVAQLATAGMERRRDEIVSALAEVLAPAAIVLRNDGHGRALEGLDPYVEVALGTAPDVVEVVEHGARFAAAVLSGQKTGWFFDHRDNRAMVAAVADGARVLDVFSYTGAWGIQAAVAGAREVICVDTSRPALDAAAKHATANGVGDRVRVEAGDAFEVLRAQQAAGERFDLVILDPPAFVRRRKDLATGLEAYQRLNRLALQVLRPGGWLASASCSSHVDRGQLLESVRRAARSFGLTLQVVGQGHQAPDHPVLPGFPESDYLKLFLLRAWPED